MNAASAGSGAVTVASPRAFDLLCVTLLVAIGAHAAHLPWWLVTGGVLALGWRWWQRRRKPGRVPAWIKLPLLALLTVAIWTSYGSIFGRAPGAALAIGLLVLKLLETETVRDTRVGASFACFTLITSLLFTQSLASTVVATAGLLPALATLRALEPAQAATSLPRSLLPGGVLLAVTLPFALIGFVLVPRLGSPLWGSSTPDQARTGLADSMAPGNFTDLLIDDSPALRVSFDGAPPPRDLRYFRAYVMWNYDGRRWTRGRRPPAPPAPVEGDGAIRYHVSMEATQTRVLPALDMPVDAPDDARLVADHEIFANRPVTAALTYTLQSMLHYRVQAVLDERSRTRALRLPPDFNPRTRALGAEWRARYGDDAKAIVQAGLAMLHDGGFRYTLAPAPLGRDAVDDFLFHTREGFCEHYASSFTVLMRSAGIPARVVTGYQGGYWNELGRYLLVRNSDAHAWTEVWLAGEGWVRVDPTAAARPERLTQGAAAAIGTTRAWYDNAWFQGMRNQWDIVNRWWGQGVIGFNVLRQRGLLTPFGVRETDTRLLALLIALSGAAFMALGLAWSLRERRAGDPLRAALRRLEKKLARAGATRRPGEGPRDYFARAARVLPGERDAIMRLSTEYLALRYGAQDPPADRVGRFRHAVAEFRPSRAVE